MWPGVRRTARSQSRNDDLAGDGVTGHRQTRPERDDSPEPDNYRSGDTNYHRV